MSKFHFYDIPARIRADPVDKKTFLLPAEFSKGFQEDHPGSAGDAN
jgi:hypothetical protein